MLLLQSKQRLPHCIFARNFGLLVWLQRGAGRLLLLEAGDLHTRVSGGDGLEGMQTRTSLRVRSSLRISLMIGPCTSSACGDDCGWGAIEWLIWLVAPALRTNAAALIFARALAGEHRRLFLPAAAAAAAATTATAAPTRDDDAWGNAAALPAKCLRVLLFWSQSSANGPLILKISI
jgi:hypothetical protein